MKTSRPSKNQVLIVTLALLVLTLALGAYLWHSQVKELKANRDSNQQKIEQLEKQIKALEETDSEPTESPPTETADPSTPTDRDIVEINKLFDQLCEGNYSPDITLDNFKNSSTSQAEKFYNGYAGTNFGCPDDTGYYIFIKRQSDKTWAKIGGTQDMPGCDIVDKYKIPKQIIKECVEYPTEVIRKNNY